MKVVVVCGATATGKTDLAFRLAKHFSSEILSFDSIQVFKFLNIGAAKPPPAMLSEIKHHFIDEVEPDHPFTAGDFRRRSLEILNNLDKAGARIAVLVGGTGFYLQALLKGMHVIPEVAPQTKLDLKMEFEKHGREKLWEELVRLDPNYAEKIHIQDSYRLLRALEILRSGEKTLTEINTSFEGEKFPYDLIQIGLRRKKPILIRAIEKRTDKMIEEGLIDETKMLLEKYGENLRPLQSVGYREAMEFLKGQIGLSELGELVTKNTVALAKRQNTWFKRDETIHWLDPDEENAFEKSKALIVARN